MGRVVEIRSYNLKAGDATLRGLRRTHRREPAAPEDAMQTPAASTHDLATLLRLNRDYVRSAQTFAIIHARTTFTGPDGNAGQGRYTDVWARRHGRWLAVSAHVTRK
jgi:hypothetical protein